ncbi:transporter substrate-binding domain-containing protein [Pseudomonas sp. NPDC007930]|uniref:substrate-binding periplasmic protein n=1 Tax=Pseudomonas sp. NPDC007930 TaxID=3364417 RepID=UPI0036E0AFCF
MTPAKLTTALLLCLLLAQPAWAEQPYQIVTEEWAPYNYLDNHRLTGMTTDIVQAIMALTGDHFETMVLPSMRSSQVLRNRPRVILYSMFRTPEREPLYKWVGPIVEEAIYPYQLASAAPPLNSLEQLLQAPRVTTRQAGLIPDVLQAKGFTNLDKSAAENQQLYLMLVAGRTGVIVGDTAAGVAYYTRQLHIAPGTLRQVPVELYRSSLYIAFSRDSDDATVTAWANALQHLRDTGELARIQQRYQQPASP